MAPLPTIHLIHASDAPQHLTKLQEILQRLKAENRIAGFVPLKIKDNVPSLNAFKGDDMAISLLTHELAAQIKEIESKLNLVKEKNRNLKVVEIILDHVPYGNEHITFPDDLRPIRDREDMDAVWRNIERKLKDIFPIVKETEEFVWRKYLKYAIPALIFLVLVLWWFFRTPKAESHDVILGFSVDQETCEAPCVVTFTNTSENAEVFEWDFDDGSTSVEANPSHNYESPGSYLVTLIATTNDESKEKSRRIVITSNKDPVADFSSSSSICVASCSVTFTNNSTNSDTFNWDFGDGNRSDEKNPSHTYENAGKFTVTLTAIGNDKKAEKKHEISITEKTPELVADFSSDKTECQAPCTVKFENGSQNASRFIWTFGDNISSNEENPYHEFQDPGDYAVTLMAIRNGETREKEQRITVTERPELVADFSSDKTECELPCRILFTNKSQPSDDSVTFRWDFGDGRRIRRRSSILHEYKESGTFTVELTASGYGQEHTKTQRITVRPRQRRAGGGNTNALNQPRQLSGTVNSANDDPLPGASVVIKGTTSGTVTDIDGKFTLSVTNSSILVISFLGFRTQEIEVSNQRQLNVTLDY